MAIVKMDKLTLLTFQRHKSALLKELQRFGDIHFKRLRKEDLDEMDFLRSDYSPEQTLADESELESVRFTISKIKPYAPKPKGLKAMMTKPLQMDFEAFDAFLETYDYKPAVLAVQAQEERIGAIRTEISRLNAENENLRIWMKLDAAPRDFSELSTVVPLFGSVNKMAAEHFRKTVERDFPDIYLELLDTVKDDTAALAVLSVDGFEEELSKLKDLGFSRAGIAFQNMPADIVTANNARIKELQQELEAAATKIEAFVPELPNLEIVSDYYATKLVRQHACENFMKTDSVVLIEGWIPAEQKTVFEGIVSRVCGDDYYLESKAVEKDNAEVPVKLKNKGFVKAFEDVTAMFATPRYNEIDPTPLLAPFYWVFFGFMVGDTGFGLVLMLGTFLALRFCSFKAGMRQFLRFFFYLSFSVILAGFVYGSFFGFTFFKPIAYTDAATGAVLYKPILDTQMDIPLMLILAIALGVVQVIFGLLVKGYMLIRDGHALDAVFDAGFWIVTLLGGIAWLVGVTGAIPAQASNIGMWCFLGGIVGLALTQGRNGTTIIGKIGSSLWEVYGISGYVGDLVSYTRIVALGLSGAFIAFSFIKMASILPAGPLGAVAGFIIIFLGETLDLGLGLLGAYVHTCRLQYVEFFGKFYEGGGKPFSPLTFKSDYIEIKK